MKTGAKSAFTRILISIIFLFNGIMYMIPAIRDFSTDVLLSLVLGVAMVLLGVLGIFHVKIMACRVISIVICVICVYFIIGIIMAGTILSNAFVSYLTLALLSWLYFDCQ